MNDVKLVAKSMYLYLERTPLIIFSIIIVGIIIITVFLVRKEIRRLK